MRIADLIGAFVLGVIPLAKPALAGQDSPSPESTKENLQTAMHGEAFAFLKYSLYAEQARNEGHPDIAAAFEAAANQERTEHFAELAKIYGLVGSSADNLADAIAGETHEATVMYPEFAATARTEGKADAADLFGELAKDEQKHADRFSSLLRSLQQSTGETF